MPNQPSAYIEMQPAEDQKTAAEETKLDAEETETDAGKPAAEGTKAVAETQKSRWGWLLNALSTALSKVPSRENLAAAKRRIAEMMGRMSLGNLLKKSNSADASTVDDHDAGASKPPVAGAEGGNVPVQVAPKESAVLEDHEGADPSGHEPRSDYD
mmetsp:Transcript_20294/g.51285  ORF Transcript_20294/g.51285 Transcript_20294/m.51285 type:complete len:156 (+) Transcript_20294:487-954(+)